MYTIVIQLAIGFCVLERTIINAVNGINFLGITILLASACQRESAGRDSRLWNEIGNWKLGKFVKVKIKAEDNHWLLVTGYWFSGNKLCERYLKKRYRIHLHFFDYQKRTFAKIGCNIPPAPLF